MSWLVSVKVIQYLPTDRIDGALCRIWMKCKEDSFCFVEGNYAVVL